MTPPIRIGFIMDQVAGHVTGYRNLRRIADRDGDIEPVWCEIHYYVEGGRIERTRERFTPFLSTHPFGVARGLVEQRRAYRRRPFDVMFTNTSIGYVDPGPVARIPTMFDFDSTPVQLDRMGGYAPHPDSRPVAAVKHRRMKRLFERVSLNQAWSNWARDSVVTDYDIDADQVVLNPPGVDLEFWNPERHAPRSDERPARVLFVGGDFERKGGVDLLDWHRSVEPGTIELDIVTREPITAHDGVHVHLGVGPNSPELTALHRTADVFVLPSKGECFGIATIEAMASGIPVVASDVGGTADIIDPGETGYIVPAGNVRELGRAIETIVGLGDRGEAMGRRARAVAEQRFDLEKNAVVTLDRLKSLATGGAH
ncbi:MAG: glycosyltransferase family 4 protein [Ilumatobacter sp.]|nr:glycosyltransferase family 4 protein [Ilumatobacter sp.]